MRIAIRVPSAQMNAALARILLAQGFRYHGDTTMVEEVNGRCSPRGDGPEATLHYHTMRVECTPDGPYRHGIIRYEWNHHCNGRENYATWDHYIDLTSEPQRLSEAILLLSGVYESALSEARR